MEETSNSQSNPKPPLMDRQLLKACCQNDLNILGQLIDHDTNILLSVTPHNNNCLHLAAMLGHEQFARNVWSRSSSLFSCTNNDGETPLIAALMAANAKLASEMLTAASQLLRPDIEGRKPLNEMLLKIDKRGDNALHHAIRNGFEDFAIVLLSIEPQLSEQMQPQQLKDSKEELLENSKQELSEERDLQLPSSPQLELQEPPMPSLPQPPQPQPPMPSLPQPPD